jgi:uncharacterized protein
VSRALLAELASPCIDVCKMDARNGLCSGCFRTLDEITGWAARSADERWRILAAVDKRRAAYDPWGSAAGGELDELRGECER